MIQNFVKTYLSNSKFPPIFVFSTENNSPMSDKVFTKQLTDLTADELSLLESKSGLYEYFEENGGKVYSCKSGCDSRVYLAKSIDGDWLTANDNYESETFQDLLSAIENVRDMLDEYQSWENMGLLDMGD